MEPSTLAPSLAKPAKWWFAVVLLAGALGASVAVGLAGKGTYDIAPFKVELRAFPAPLGKTELAIGAVQGFVPSHAEAGTHKAPLVFKATIKELTAAPAPDDLKVGTSPKEFNDFLTENGKHAKLAFGLKLLLLSALGGALGGAAVAMKRWRRIAGGAVAGVLALAVVGLMVQRTYDSKQFSKTRYVVDAPKTSPTGGVLPSL